MLVFAIFDSKAEAYMQPWFAPTKGVALRNFAQAANDTSSDFHRFAADYTLFEIGTWDQHTGDLVAHDAKLNLGTALEFVKSTEPTKLAVVGDHD